jgi:hypothetical protein
MSPLNPAEEPDSPFAPEVLPDEELHAAEAAAIPHEDALKQWGRWKANPHPQRMADVLRSLQPVIDKSVARFPRYNAAILGGEAKRLAIAAVKSYDPAQGAALSSHVYNHIKPLGRNLANLSRAIPLSRLERQRASAFLAARNDLREMHGREPDDSQLQDHLGVNAENLAKMRRAARGEVAESEADHLGASEDHQEDAGRLRLWSDYVHHDATPLEKQIMDLSMGRNGHPVHDGERIAAQLNLSPQYVNRKREEIARRIVEGMRSMENEE